MRLLLAAKMLEVAQSDDDNVQYAKVSNGGTLFYDELWKDQGRGASNTSFSLQLGSCSACDSSRESLDRRTLPRTGLDADWSELLECPTCSAPPVGTPSCPSWLQELCQCGRPTSSKGTLSELTFLGSPSCFPAGTQMNLSDCGAMVPPLLVLSSARFLSFPRWHTRPRRRRPMPRSAQKTTAAADVNDNWTFKYFNTWGRRRLCYCQCQVGRPTVLHARHAPSTPCI